MSKTKFNIADSGKIGVGIFNDIRNGLPDLLIAKAEMEITVYKEIEDDNRIKKDKKEYSQVRIFVNLLEDAEIAKLLKSDS